MVKSEKLDVADSSSKLPPNKLFPAEEDEIIVSSVHFTSASICCGFLTDLAKYDRLFLFYKQFIHFYMYRAKSHLQASSSAGLINQSLLPPSKRHSCGSLHVFARYPFNEPTGGSHCTSGHDCR